MVANIFTQYRRGHLGQGPDAKSAEVTDRGRKTEAGGFEQLLESNRSAWAGHPLKTRKTVKINPWDAEPVQRPPDHTPRERIQHHCQIHKF
jgi:hypothetical protein